MKTRDLIISSRAVSGSDSLPVTVCALFAVLDSNRILVARPVVRAANNKRPFDPDVMVNLSSN